MTAKLKAVSLSSVDLDPWFDSPTADEACQAVQRYHEETKLDVDRLVRNQRELDWEMQPNPFRRYEGASLLSLPFMLTDDTPPYHQIYERRSIPSRPVNLKSLGQLFELSLAVSGWKEVHGQRWPLRVNPSSGNLHPTECYLLVGELCQNDAASDRPAAPALCHYASAEHALEIRARIPEGTWQRLMAEFPPSSFLIGLTSIYWREAWKYGARAYRYCQHDMGHALAALTLSAAGLGWRLALIDNISDSEISALLAINDQTCEDIEREHPGLLAIVIPNTTRAGFRPHLPSEAIKETAIMTTWGTANRISESHVRTEAIEQVLPSCIKPNTSLLKYDFETVDKYRTEKDSGSKAPTYTPPLEPSARRVIYQRRSASSFDGVTEIPSSDFFSILQRTMRKGNGDHPMTPPWDAIPARGYVHLCLFVHRVVGMKPGLYILVREVERLLELRSCMRTDFAWERVPGSPPNLPLFLLQEGDCQQVAQLASCGQSLAADATFSLAMVAEFKRSLCDYGAWYYRRLFWEAGMIGQILYLEAEALGISSTGLGCFLDDVVHEAFGFSGWQYQSLYNFAVGAPIKDERVYRNPLLTVATIENQ